VRIAASFGKYSKMLVKKEFMIKKEKRDDE